MIVERWTWHWRAYRRLERPETLSVWRYVYAPLYSVGGVPLSRETDTPK